MSDKTRSAHKLRHRVLAVTIWNDDSDTGPFYSVTASRICKQGDAKEKRPHRCQTNNGRGWGRRLCFTVNRASL